MSGALTVSLLAVFILIGLVAHERYGLRLGGVLVLPLLLLYAISDVRVIGVFVVSAALIYAVGELVHRTTLLYGRRLFIVYLLVSLVITFTVGTGLGIADHGRLFPLLPGLFAFNLHREGRPIRGSLAFVGWMGLFTMLGVAVISFVNGTPAFADPIQVPFPNHPLVPNEVRDTFCGGLLTINSVAGESIAECSPLDVE